MSEAWHPPCWQFKTIFQPTKITLPNQVNYNKPALFWLVQRLFWRQKFRTEFCSSWTSWIIHTKKWLTVRICFVKHWVKLEIPIWVLFSLQGHLNIVVELKIKKIWCETIYVILVPTSEISTFPNAIVIIATLEF